MIRINSSYSLLKNNTFGIDVKAEKFVEFDTEDELVQIIKNGLKLPLLVIGGGSNLLFINDFSGTVLHSRILGTEVVPEDEDFVYLRAGSGINWDELVAYTVEQGWQGFENLAAIPGEVGASAVQNIGAYGVEVGDFIERVDALSLADGSKRSFSREECRFAYRNSIFKQEEKGKYVVTFVTYRLRKKPEYRLTYGNLRQQVEALGGVNVKNIERAVRCMRASKLPSPEQLGSAGSFFMNPVVPNEVAANLAEKYPEMPQYRVTDGVKLSAGWLIEYSGWKGKRIGNVGVYERQALVIVNHGGATGREVYDFSEAVCQAVYDKFGIHLHREVNVIE